MSTQTSPSRRQRKMDRCVSAPRLHAPTPYPSAHSPTHPPPPDIVGRNLRGLPLSAPSNPSSIPPSIDIYQEELREGFARYEFSALRLAFGLAGE